MVRRHVVPPDPQPLLLGLALGDAQLLGEVAVSHAPVDHTGEAYLHQLDAHVAHGVEHAAKERAALVHAVQLHFDFAVQQPRLDEETRLSGERRRILVAILAAPDGGALDAGEHHGDLVEAWEQHHAQHRTRGDLLDDGVLRLALELLQQHAGVEGAGPVH